MSHWFVKVDPVSVVLLLVSAKTLCLASKLAYCS